MALLATRLLVVLRCAMFALPPWKIRRYIITQHRHVSNVRSIPIMPDLNRVNQRKVVLTSNPYPRRRTAELPILRRGESWSGLRASLTKARKPKGEAM